MNTMFRKSIIAILSLLCIFLAVMIYKHGKECKREKEMLIQDYETQIHDLKEEQENSQWDVYNNGWVHGYVFSVMEYGEKALEIRQTDVDVIANLDPSLFPDSPGIINSNLDALGRAGPAYASLHRSLLPDAPRSSLNGKNPIGFQSMKFDFVPSGGWLYNRTHLIGNFLGGSDYIDNLITGTQWLNQMLMYPLEAEIYDYLCAYDGIVHFSVIPLYLDDELIARGLYFYAQSMSDDIIRISAYLPNRQPLILINYSDGSATVDPDQIYCIYSED